MLVFAGLTKFLSINDYIAVLSLYPLLIFRLLYDVRLFALFPLLFTSKKESVICISFIF